MKDQALRRVSILFLLIAVVLIGVAIQAVRSINGSVATSDWVNHTHAVILETEALRAALLVGDGALHTYVLTGDARDLAASRNAIDTVAEHFETLKALTRQEPAQQDLLKQVEPLVSRREDFVQGILTVRQANNVDTVRASLAAGVGATALQEIQRLLDRLKKDELALLTERDTASYLQAQMTRWIVWTGVVLDVLLLGGVAWLIRDDLAARRRAAAILHEANEQLEARVQARTAELTAANSQLSTENLERQWANKALEHQVRYNQMIVDSVGDLVLVLTKALNISRVNPAVTHVTGREPSELVNEPLARVVRLLPAEGATSPPMLDPIAQALNTGRDLRALPAIVEDKRGRQIPARFTMFPLRDGDKVVGGIVTIQVSLTAGEGSP